MIQDDDMIDVLVGHGIKWMSKDEHYNEILMEKSNETFMIARNEKKKIKLITNNELMNNNYQVLCVDDRQVYKINEQNWIFKRSSF